MESSLQKIIAAIVGVIILFIVPVYISFEKIDDISYSLALKLTQNFIDNVRNKGYISPEMYADYVTKLYNTNNSYDIQIEHVKKTYYPAINIYEYVDVLDAGGIVVGTEKKLVQTRDYDKYVLADGNVPSSIELDGIEYTDIEKTHVINEEHITDKQILDKLFENTGITKTEFLEDCRAGHGNLYDSLAYINENSYLMNEGDEINVTVKNKNTTAASVLYSMLTANISADEVPKIYVEYGGTVNNDGDITNIDNSHLLSSSTGTPYPYTGTVKTVNLFAGKYEIQCWGASGGYDEDAGGAGKGAYVKATFNFDEDVTLYVYVGGKGKNDSESNHDNGGFNGGGDSRSGYGGGGATDIRLLLGEPDDVESLLTRIIVAAGGGGASKVYSGDQGAGGAGGDFTSGLNGTSLNNSPGRVGLGALISNPKVGYEIGVINSKDEMGDLGKGGSVDFAGAGGGGAGYYGGSAAHYEYAGGGGGLSYVYKNENISSKLSSYDPITIDEVIPLLDATNGWKGVSVDTSSIEVLNGNTLMPNYTPYEGNMHIQGNKGNGYVRIKKLD